MTDRHQAAPRTHSQLRCCPPFLRDRVTVSDLMELSTRFAAVAHPVRLNLLSQLAHASEMTSTDLVGFLGRSQATVSHHTSLLHGVGLISVDRDGRDARWKLDHQGFQLLSGALRP